MANDLEDISKEEYETFLLDIISVSEDDCNVANELYNKMVKLYRTFKSDSKAYILHCFKHKDGTISYDRKKKEKIGSKFRNKKK